MKILLAIAAAAIVAACSAPKASPPASVPDVLNPTTGAAMAQLWCPAADATALKNCTDAVIAAAGGSLPAELCVFAGSGWSLVTPKPGDRSGSTCGTDGSGTVRGVIVAP